VQNPIKIGKMEATVGAGGAAAKAKRGRGRRTHQQGNNPSQPKAQANKTTRARTP